MQKIIILDSDHNIAIPEMKKLFQGLTLLRYDERSIKQNICGAVRELVFAIKSYKALHQSLLSEGTTEELEHYCSEINAFQISQKTQKYEIVLDNTKLSHFFKSYLINVKVLLDKATPLIHLRYKNFNSSKFESRGKHLLGYLKNKYTGDNKELLIELLTESRNGWLDEVLNLRDDIVHNSDFPEYQDFTLIVEKPTIRQIKNLHDFAMPSLLFRGERVDAVEFLESIHDKTLVFLNKLLLGFGFDSYRKPDFVMKCQRCDFQMLEINMQGIQRVLEFKKETSIDILDKQYKLGVITCPECDAQMETDLAPFQEFGFLHAKL